MSELDDFTFDEDLHEYRNAQNVLRPSVTQVLKICGAIDFSHVPLDLLERKRVIGTNVHKWSADYDRPLLNGGIRTDPIDDISLSDEEWGYAQGWMKFCDEVRPKWLHIEQKMLRTVGGIEVGGTPDRICLIGRRLYVVDIKCSACLAPAWRLQTAMYEMMHTGHAKVGVLGRMIVRLTADGKYRPPTIHDDTSDAAGALHMLGAATWLLNAGLKKVA